MKKGNWKAVAADESAKERAREAFKQHTNASGNLDVLERCKRLNEFLTQDFMKPGQGNSKADLEQILALLGSGPKRPACLDKPPITQMSSKKGAAVPPSPSGKPSPAVHYLSSGLGDFDADRLLGVLDLDEDCLGSSAQSASSGCTALLQGSNPDFVSNPHPPHASTPEDVDDLIGLLNGDAQLAEQHQQRWRQREGAKGETSAQVLAANEEQQKMEEADKARREQDSQLEAERKQREVQEQQKRIEEQAQLQQQLEKGRQEKELQAQREEELRRQQLLRQQEEEQRQTELRRGREEEEQRLKLQQQQEEEERQRRLQVQLEEQERQRQKDLQQQQEVERRRLKQQQEEEERQRQRQIQQQWEAAACQIQAAVRAMLAQRALARLRALHSIRRSVAARVIQVAWRVWASVPENVWKLGPLREASSTHIQRRPRPISAVIGSLSTQPVRLRAPGDCRSANMFQQGDGCVGEGHANRHAHRTVSGAHARSSSVRREEALQRGDVATRAVMAASEHRNTAAAIEAARRGSINYAD